MSYGKMLCAWDKSKPCMEPLMVPEGVQLGEKITFDGFQGETGCLSPIKH